MLKKKILAGVITAALMMSMGTGAAFADTAETAGDSASEIEITTQVDEDAPILISAPVNGGGIETIVPVEEGLTVNDKVLDLKAAGTALYVKNGNVMVPLRAVAETLGYKVSWDNTEKAAKLDNGKYGMTLTIGSDSYARYSTVEGMVGVTAPQTFGAVPELVNSVTYVPAGAFQLLGYAVEVNDADTGVRISEIIELENEPSVQIPNPIVEYDTKEAAEKACGFETVVPASLKDAEAEYINVIDHNLFQIQYVNGSYYRVEEKDVKKGIVDDISGDYNTYASVKDITVKAGENTFNVKAKGSKDGSVKYAVWSNDRFAYCISYGTETSYETLEKNIASIF